MRWVGKQTQISVYDFQKNHLFLSEIGHEKQKMFARIIDNTLYYMRLFNIL